MENPWSQDQLLIRPLRLNDLEAFYEMTQHSGVGITSMTPLKNVLEERLGRVEESFSQRVSPHKRLFLFGLERLAEKKLIGTCGVKLCTGYKLPFYNYKIGHIVQHSRSLNKTFHHRVLHLVNDYQDAAELGSLFLLPEYRKAHRGAFLSRVRFLFMANYLDQFPDLTIAEMRGVSDKEGHSPFWDALIKPFFGMNFGDADFLTSAQHKQFIADLMPKYPIYLELLKPEAQAVVGKTHPETEPAVHFLKHEHFHYREYIDIFDGGPVVEALTGEIYSVRESRIQALAKIQKTLKHPVLAMVCNIPPNSHLPDFRATLAQVEGNIEPLILDEASARSLKAEVGSHLRVCRFHKTVPD